MIFEKNDLTTIKIKDVPVEKACNMETIFDSVSFVRLSNEANAVLGGINQLIVKDSLIFIRDCYGTKKIKIFSLSGRYLGTVGNYGRGPGEYLEPTFMQVNDQNVIVWDQFSRLLSFYDFNGKFIHSISSPYFSMKFYFKDTDHILFNTISSDNDRYRAIVDYSLFECNQKFEITNRGFFRKKNSYENIIYDHNFFERDDMIYFRPPYCDTLYSIDNSNVIRAKYAFDFGKHTVPEKLRRGTNIKTVRKEQAGSRYMFMEGDIHLTDDYMHFGYVKAHRGFDCIYSLASGELISFYRRTGFFPLVFANIIGSTDNALIGYFFPAMVSNKVAGWKDIPYDSLVSQFGRQRAELGLSMKPDDNPVITFFYLPATK